MFHLFHLFHRVLMSERYLHVPLVLPVPPAVNIWERVACSTCSTICFSWSIFSTVCLCLGEIRLFYLFHQFHWLSLSGIFFACSTCSTYSTCCTCSTGCQYLGEFYIFHLFNLLHLFARMFISGKDLLDPPVPSVPLCVYVWERYACSTCFTFFICAMCVCL